MACPMRQELNVNDIMKIVAENTRTDAATVAVAIQTILFLAYSIFETKMEEDINKHSVFSIG